jgi:hypothetical protein
MMAAHTCAFGDVTTFFVSGSDLGEPPSLILPSSVAGESQSRLAFRSLRVGSIAGSVVGAGSAAVAEPTAPDSAGMASPLFSIDMNSFVINHCRRIAAKARFFYKKRGKGGSFLAKRSSLDLSSFRRKSGSPFIPMLATCERKQSKQTVEESACACSLLSNVSYLDLMCTQIASRASEGQFHPPIFDKIAHVVRIIDFFNSGRN